MKKIYSIVITYFYLINFVDAQQLPRFHLFIDNPIQVNPASLPIDMILDQNSSWRLGLMSRLQWLGVGFDKAPANHAIEAQYFSRNSESVNWVNGVQILNDRNGRFGQTAFFVNSSAQFILSKNRLQGPRLSIGLSGGMVNYQLNLNDVKLNAQEELGTGGSVTKPDFGIGAYFIVPFPYTRWITGHKFYVGLSIPQILSGTTSFQAAGSAKYDIIRSRHYYCNTGLSLNYENIRVEPSLWVRYHEGAPISFDATTRLVIQKTYRVGIGYSSGKMAHVLMGMRFSSWKKGRDSGREGIYINYSFGYQMADLQTLGSAHEVSFTYHW